MCYDYQRFLLRFPLFVSFRFVIAAASLWFCLCMCSLYILLLLLKLFFYALLNDITIFCPFSCVIQSCHTKREPLLMCASSLSHYSIPHNSMTIFSNDKLFDDEKMVLTIRVNDCENMAFIKSKTNKWEIQRN